MSVNDLPKILRANTGVFGVTLPVGSAEVHEVVSERFGFMHTAERSRTLSGIQATCAMTDRAEQDYKAGMDIKELRRANLRLLAKRAGNPTELSKKLGKSTSYIGQIIGRSPRRGIGDTIAREIEQTLELPRGWMDQAHTLSGLDPDIMIRAVRLVEESIRLEKLSPTDEKRARLYIQVYKGLQAATLDLADVRELVRLVA